MMTHDTIGAVIGVAQHREEDISMFYVMKRARVADCRLGDRVMVLSDYPGGNIIAGEKGTVDEIYGDEGTGLGRGISIRWDKTGFCDGFGEDELEHLGFGTETWLTDAEVAA